MRAVLLAFSVLCALVLAMRISAWSEQHSVPRTLVLATTLITLTLALVQIAIRGKRSTVQRVLFELAALGVAFVSVELLIAAWVPDPRDTRGLRERAAARLNLPFDSRYVSDVVQDLRREGVDALPGLTAIWPQLAEVRRFLPTGLYPLSHASNAVVVECNESGHYLTYRTDEWGFNNPAGILAADDIDIAVVGESYVLGHCLPAKQTLVGRIREQYPRTANFGIAANLTLTQLASVREFVEPLRPRVVLWAVNPVFVASTEDVLDPLLVRYLDPTFSQQLVKRQKDINRLVRGLAIPVQVELDRQARIKERQTQIGRMAAAWRLPETRAQFGRAMGVGTAEGVGADLTAFMQSLQLVHAAVEQWGGKLIVVLLPIFAEVVAGQIGGNVRHDHLSQIVSQMGIPVVDGVELFESQSDPASLFTMRTINHPTAEGYALLANHVLTEVQSHYRRRKQQEEM